MKKPAGMGLLEPAPPSSLPPSRKVLVLAVVSYVLPHTTKPGPGLPSSGPRVDESIHTQPLMGGNDLRDWPCCALQAAPFQKHASQGDPFIQLSECLIMSFHKLVADDSTQLALHRSTLPGYRKSSSCLSTHIPSLTGHISGFPLYRKKQWLRKEMEGLLGDSPTDRNTERWVQGPSMGA